MTAVVSLSFARTSSQARVLGAAAMSALPITDARRGLRVASIWTSAMDIAPPTCTVENGLWVSGWEGVGSTARVEDCEEKRTEQCKKTRCRDSDASAEGHIDSAGRMQWTAEVDRGQAG